MADGLGARKAPSGLAESTSRHVAVLKADPISQGGLAEALNLVHGFQTSLGHARIGVASSGRCHQGLLAQGDWQTGHGQGKEEQPSSVLIGAVDALTNLGAVSAQTWLLPGEQRRTVER